MLRQKPEEGIHDGVDGESETTLKIQFTNGNLLTGDTTATTVSAKVLKGAADITSEYAASAFVWTRDTGNATADTTWNAAHNGVKTFTMNAADLTEDAKLTCTLAGTSTDYGTVYVDEDMNLIHAPAEADANDTLHLENGILSVETPNNEYHLNDNVLGVVRHRLNGSVTAEAWVYTAAPEKLVEFKYDSNGLRTQKKVTDHGQVVVTEYIYHGQKLVGLTCGNDTLHFFYDAQGRPAQVQYNGEMLNYVVNLQGDIVGIWSREGYYISQYIYDPYGVPAYTIDSSHTLASNAFQYRGYVYDEEIQMYYVKDRFYHSKTGRFLNADINILDKQVPINMNQYVYCRNSPILRYDPNGKSSHSFTSFFDDLYLSIYFYLEAICGRTGDNDVTGSEVGQMMTSRLRGSQRFQKQITQMAHESRESGKKTVSAKWSVQWKPSAEDEQDLALSLGRVNIDLSVTYIDDVGNQDGEKPALVGYALVEYSLRDTYDFDWIEGDGRVAAINNLFGWYLQENGTLTNYDIVCKDEFKEMVYFYE